MSNPVDDVVTAPMACVSNPVDDVVTTEITCVSDSRSCGEPTEETGAQSEEGAEGKGPRNRQIPQSDSQLGGQAGIHVGPSQKAKGHLQATIKANTWLAGSLAISILVFLSSLAQSTGDLDNLLQWRQRFM